MPQGFSVPVSATTETSRADTYEAQSFSLRPFTLRVPAAMYIHGRHSALVLGRTPAVMAVLFVVSCYRGKWR